MPAMSEENFCRLAEEYTYIPVWIALSGDMDTPVSLVKKLGGCVYLLESVEKGLVLGRFSFIGIDALLTINVRGQKCTVSGPEDIFLPQGTDPLVKAAQILKSLNVAPVEELTGFYGGAVGYLGYGLVSHLENIPQNGLDDLGIADCNFVVAKTLLQIDHLNHQVKLIALTPKGNNPRKSFLASMQYLSKLIQKLERRGKSCYHQSTYKPTGFQANMTREQFIEKVEKAKEYIRAGDIFQVVLSQRFTTEVSEEPFEIYRRLRTINPSPYMYFLDFKELQLIGSSPEMLVRVTNRMVETCPIAGTRPRGKSSIEDEILAQELREDPKERAEHLMLVDLGRNDLGRVCEFGSVNLESFMEVERFSHVSHLVSRVKGELSVEKTPIDALKVCFPAGTVSGAPKIRAMEIIEELEPTRRGPYAGAIAYLGFDAKLDSCITIRTILVKSGRAYIQAGAGIVADSNPETEYQETVNKAMALMAAVSPTEEEKSFAFND